VKPVAAVALAAVIVGERHAEMELDVRHVEIGRFQEAAAFGEFEVNGPRRSRRYWPIARNSRGRLSANAVEVRIVDM